MPSTRTSLKPHAGKGRPLLDPKQLVELYSQGHSTVQIAKMFGVSPQAVWSRLRQLGVRIRSYSEAQRLRYQRERANRKEVGEFDEEDTVRRVR